LARREREEAERQQKIRDRENVQLPLGEVAIYTILFVVILLTLYKVCFAKKSEEQA